MFFRRVFSRKGKTDSIDSSDDSQKNGNNKMLSRSPKKVHKYTHTVLPEDKRSLTVLQLTPLWEHIIRTRKLPDDLNQTEMFAEFMERLRDPEWQVRQHALRVLVDVLIVIGKKADAYFSPIVPQLVENLGHPAPTVRKGALDALRIYIAETAMPETILLEIMDIGLNQRITTEPFGGRLTCGVMLSLPALVQATLHTPKRDYILHTTIDKLTNKMSQVTHQEITLKVLLRIRDMIGPREFSEHMPRETYREFQLLCDIYGLDDKKYPDTVRGSLIWHSTDTDDMSPTATNNSKNFGSSFWKYSDSFEKCTNSSTPVAKKFGSSIWNSNVQSLENTDDTILKSAEPRRYGSSLRKERGGQGNIETINKCHINNLSDDSYWRPSSSSTTFQENVKNHSENQPSDDNDKIIMETEIKINDDTLTMRILETKDEHDEEDERELVDTESEDEEQNSDKVTSPIENTGIIQVLTDSELEEINNGVDIDFVRRTPKRVTFGGEIIKMRTPDSDILVLSDNDDRAQTHQHLKQPTENMNFLTIEIPNDNTKPIPSPNRLVQGNYSPKSKHSPENSSSVSPSSKVKGADNTTASPVSPKRISTPSVRPGTAGSEDARQKSASPKRRFHKISISPVDNIISPKPVHNEITILHNLQRSPCISPPRIKRQSSKDSEMKSPDQDLIENGKISIDTSPQNNNQSATVVSNAKSWEDLNLVDENTLHDLNSGDWRYRLRAVANIEEALKPSENLALIQPHLDSLLRTLLSSEKNADVTEDKRRIVMNLISRLPLDNLEGRANQIITGLCRQGGAGSNRVSKALMQRLPPAVIVLKLLSEEFLHARSSRFRENALQMVMYALMTFPSTYFDTSTCVSRAIYAALDRKKRVRQAALDVLAVLGQVTSPRIVIDITQSIASTREDGSELCAAVKARLARKQLPIVGHDGTVQYTLRIPSPKRTNKNNGHGSAGIGEGVAGIDTEDSSVGADIEWISSGIGSVSPTSLKRRQQTFLPIHRSNCPPLQHRKGINNSNRIYISDGSGSNSSGIGNNSKFHHAPHEILAVGVGVKPVEEYMNAKSRKYGKSGNTDIGKSNTQQLSFMNAPSVQVPSIVTANEGLTYSINKSFEKSINRNFINQSNGDISAIYGERISVRSHSQSDSSQDDGRTNHDSKKMLNNERGMRIPLTSRFPAMERSEDIRKNTNRHQYRNSYQSIRERIPEGTGESNSYSKQNFSVNPQYMKMRRTQHSQDSFNESNFDELPQTFNYPTFRTSTPQGQGGKRFLNSDKYTQLRSNKHEKGFLHELQQNNQSDDIYLGEDLLIRKLSTPSKSVEKLNTQLNNNDIKEVNINNIQQNADNNSCSSCVESSEISSEERGNSGRSTPTLVIGDIIQPISVHIKRNSTGTNEDDRPIFSRSQSIASISRESKNPSRPNSTDVFDRAEDMPARPKSVVSKKSISSNTEECNVLSEDEVDNITILNIEENVILEDNNMLTGNNHSTENMEARTVDDSNIVEDKETPIENDADTKVEINTESPPLVEEEPFAVENIETIEEIELTADNTTEINADAEINSPEKHPTPDVEPPIEIVNLEKEEEIEIEEIPAPISPPVPALSREASMMKSTESIYETSNTAKTDTDTKSVASTETSSDYQGSLHAVSLDGNKDYTVKPVFTPAMKKSKTTLFSRNRKIAPARHSTKQRNETIPQTLTKFERPKEALHQAITQLDSVNWETVLVGLKSLVRLMRYHPHLIDTQIHMVCIQLSKSVKNLRSQVARAACQASGEMFTVQSKYLEQECDDLTASLFHRTADTNRFIRADATRALESMCDHLTTAKVIHIIVTRGAAHQNAVVRTTSAKLLNRLADQLGCERIFALPRDQRDKIIITGSHLLMEGSLETRSYAKSLFRCLSDYSHYNRLLLEIIPPRTYRNIEKTLKTIR